jgi:hypothetical protein
MCVLFLNYPISILYFKSSTLRAPVPSTSGEPMPSTSREPMPSTSAAITELGVPLPSSSKDDVFPSTESGGSAVAEAENYFLRQQIEELNKKMSYMSLRFCYQNVQGSDKLILLYSGLPKHSTFEALYDLFKDVELNYYLGWAVQKIENIDQLLLTLMKLRLNAPHLDPAERFYVSQATVSNIFLTYIHAIHEILFEQLMSDIPSRSKNKMCLPNCFSSFTECRLVLDCTEIFTVVSRKSMAVQKQTYSAYKHHHTFKGLVGVAPNGVVTYVSDLYAGATSDKKIVQDCGVLDKLQTGDLILADKGFLIQDILPPGVNLNIPPFLRTPQFTPAQVRQTQSIARARIHVERASCRIKSFRILSNLPETLCPFGDIIFKGVAALTNLQYPLIKEVEHLFLDDAE